MNCQVCHVQPAKYPMFPTTATDETRSHGGDLKPVPMCQECAMDAFEQGTHESDGELDEQDVKPVDPFLNFAANYLKNIPNGAK